ncbi:MAG: CPBP family intramembrane glutamic endopeptidase [Halobacteriaceae archaeon]
MSRHPRLVSAESQQPLRDAAVFVTLTFGIAAVVYLPLLAEGWGWIDLRLPQGLVILGVLSPGIATLLIRLSDEGIDGVRSALGGLTAWRFGLVWWGIALALPVAFALGLAGGVIALGQDFSPEPIRIVSEAGAGFVLLILLRLVTAAGEELGWRGHLLPLLQARLSALNASLVIAAVWGVWHLPLLIGNGVEGPVIALRLVSTIGGAVMFTWLFNNTGGSVLAVTLLHAGNNLWGQLLATSPTVQPAATVFTAENLLLAVVLLALYGGATLTDRRSLSGR